MRLDRLTIEQLYRKYFLEIRGWKEFPLTIDLKAVKDFVEWLETQKEKINHG